MLPSFPGDAARSDLRSLSFSELSALVSRLGERPYRARQLYSWLHRKAAASLDAMTDLPHAFRERLAAETRLATLAVDAVQESRDGTRKYRMRTQDGKFIESVYMPDEAGPESFDPEADEDEVGPATRVRRTLCVSTQVGCAMGCGFCMTATMGLVRNLSAGEICDQIYRVNADLHRLGVSGERPLTNLVYMGMGEPLHNYENVMRSLELLLSEEGANFSQLMPVDRKWNIAALIDAVRKFPSRQGRRVTFEYVLLRDVNDSDEDAARLAALLRDLPVKVNLIPYNENPGLGFGDPGAERVAAFRKALSARGITAMVRKNRGRDIAAACGQLAVQV
ncbi:MAG: 23S rRNA (adenine(2503)-C(2))-methyltransferase RlmN [Deltaproteobacteria bacterium]|nr:MAG: 23S rRNA (adenine(2503)-C(2))-methyltransferase RlmN [Deltaproteobacteria bacterium]